MTTDPTGADPRMAATLKTPKQVIEQALCLSMGMCNTAMPHALIHRLEQEGYEIVAKVIARHPADAATNGGE
jgi:hypothetical protein